MKKQNGVTLIELMVVVVIVAILAAIVLPNYQSYVMKSHRSAAINAIMNLGSVEARYYTTNNSYSSSMTTLGYASDPMPVLSTANHYYDLSVQPPTAANPIATTFILQAVPVGTQANDACGTYTYNYLGQKGSTGLGASESVNDCWKQ